MLSPRQQKILSAVIKEYTKTAAPVASNTLAKKHNFRVSPATIRTDLSWLEKRGLLRQPHISAGRIPTDKGYRYFVDRLMKTHTLTRKEQDLAQKELLDLTTEFNRLVKSTARLLSLLSDNLGMSSVLDLELIHNIGINKLITEPEFSNSRNFIQMTETLDWFGENIQSLFKTLNAEVPQIYIGQENPLRSILPHKRPNYSIVVAGFRFPSGEKGLVAIIGPKRMRYSRNVSLVSYVTKLLSGGMMIFLILNF